MSVRPTSLIMEETKKTMKESTSTMEEEWTCNYCHYTFIAEEKPEQCPLCYEVGAF